MLQIRNAVIQIGVCRLLDCRVNPDNFSARFVLSLFFVIFPPLSLMGLIGQSRTGERQFSYQRHKSGFPRKQERQERDVIDGL